MAVVLGKQKKRWTYEEQEYWIGDPANRAFEVWTLSAGRYELHSSAEERGLVSSKLLHEFQFDLFELQ